MAESERVKLLSVDAMAQSTKSVLYTIKDASDMLQDSVPVQDQILFKSVVDNLFEQPRKSTSQGD